MCGLEEACANGDCVPDPEVGYKCNCMSGWTGESCDKDIDDCDKSNCGPNGNCQDSGPNDFTCNCAQGWVGPECRVEDICVTDFAVDNSNPGGASSKGGESFEFTCKEGFSPTSIADCKDAKWVPGPICAACTQTLEVYSE